MPIFAALEFLTRIRVRRGAVADLAAVTRAQHWFAAVGLLIGALLLGIDWLATRALPEASVDVLLVVALAAITGGLHLDGLADAADGLFGGGTPERRLAIMRDVHAGSYAIIAVVAVLGLKWAGLVALPSELRHEAILIVPCISRASMVLAIGAFPYAREEGLGAAFHARAWPVAVIACVATAIAGALLLFGASGLIVVAFGAVGALAIGAYAARLAGGLTGDIYGAIVEITEAAVWLFIAAYW